MSLQLEKVYKQIKESGVQFSHDDFNVEMMRKGAERSAQIPPLNEVEYEVKEYDGIMVDVATPKEILTKNIIIYIHGGGMVSGDPRYVRAFTSFLAKTYGGQVFGIVYGLAPEYKFPEPVEHSVRAYKAIEKEHRDVKISLLGESAGAYQVVAVTLMLKEQRYRLPDVVVPYAPIIDMSEELDRSLYPDDPVIDYRAMEDMKAYFCKENQDMKDPILSPLYADFSGFPPMRIVWDADECLSVDARKLVEISRKAGVTVEAKEWKGTFHTFEMVIFIIPEAKKEVKDTIEFIKKCTEK